MIELTKTQFTSVLARLRTIDSSFVYYTDTAIMEHLIITKYHFQVGVSNLVVSDYTSKNPVFVFKLNSYLYNDNANYIDYAWTDMPSPTGFSFSGGNLYFTPSSTLFPTTTGYYDCVVIFWEDSQGIGSPVYDFSGTNIKSIDYIGNGFDEINFTGNMPYLEEVNLSNNNTSLFVGYGDYGNASTLVTGFYNGNYRNIALSPKAFAGSPIKKIVLPESAGSYTIPESCFEGCTELLEVIVPRSVTSIGKNAFKKCTNLRYVSIPASVTTIGSGAFEECTSNLLEFDVNYDNLYFVGLPGALLRRKPDKTFSIMYASIAIQSWSGTTEDKYVDSNEWPSFYSPSTTPICYGMAKKTGGNVTIYDTHGNVITTTGLIITESNINTRRSQDGYYAGNNYILPISYFITEIEPRACVGQLFINFNCNGITGGAGNFYFPSLNTVGNEAFKGCNYLQNFTMPGAPGLYDNNKFVIATTMSIGDSAFEGCPGLSSLYILKPTTLGAKAFFGCTSLGAVYFGDYPPTDPLSEIGQLCFGNTPNLASITCNTIQDTGGNSDTVNTVRFNAIVSQSPVRGIYVGCKNTTLEDWMSEGIHTVLDYAFYGCTGFVGNSIYGDSSPVGYLNNIGNFAFYGCSGLVSTKINPITFYDGCNIGNKAFYGCTSIQYLNIESPYPGTTTTFTIGAMAFANTNINEIYIPSGNRITSLANDAFDNCPLQIVNIASNGSANTIVAGSVDTVTNALMTYINSGNISLIKSGDGKDIVNTDWSTTNIVQIYDNAFSSSNMNVGNNTTIHIPATVQYVGKTILKGSKTDNLITGDPNNPCDLTLDGNFMQVWSDTAFDNDGYSIALLFYVGGRYFRKIVENTDGYESMGFHYYGIDKDGLELNREILVYEYLDEGESTLIARIAHDSIGITLTVYARVHWDYTAEDNNSHVTTLDDPITLVLLYANQLVSPAEEAVYCADGIQGTDWMSIEIPQDFPARGTKIMRYEPYITISSDAFADCKWVNNVSVRKLLSNTMNAFKGCTNLQTIEAADTTNQNDIRVSIFDGVVPKGTFDGCTNFQGIVKETGEQLQYPIVFNENAFNGCTSYTNLTDDMLLYGMIFGKNSFSGSGLTTLNLVSACSIDSQAFVGCNFNDVMAESTCGYYFTGDDGGSIVNDNNVIVVGSKTCNPNSAKGVGDYACSKLGFINEAANIEISNKYGYIIGKEAFSGSTITTFSEDNCSGTQIGDGAFKGCQSLLSVSFDVLSGFGTGAFENCTSLNYAKIPRHEIPANSFKGCISLPSFTAEGSIGANAFSGCTSLTTFYFNYDPADDIIINPTAFINCPLTTITFANDTSDYTFDNNGVYTYDAYDHVKLVIGTKAFVIADAQTNVIGEHAFNGRGIIGEITIPGSVTKIEDYAFANNPGIVTVHIPATVKYIGAHAFDGCTSLVRMVMPDSCEYIGEGAFKNCPLTEGFNCNCTDDRYQTSHPLTPSPLSGAGNSTLRSSLDLRPVYWINTIGNDTFAGTNVECIYLPEGCTVVEDNAFYQCSNLRELHITINDTNYINTCAFYGCANLTDIYLHHKVVPTVQDDSTIFWQAGNNVDRSKRHLHVVSEFATETAFTQSTFYKLLVTQRQFNVVGDLTE